MTNIRMTECHITNIAVCLSMLGIAVVVASTASAQSQSNANVDTVTCAGTLNGTGAPFGYANVIVDGGSCVLDGVVVQGSVKVSNGGSLTSKNGTEVDGAVEVKSGGGVTLRDTTVSGAVTLDDSGSLTVEAASTTGSVTVRNSGNVTVGVGASTGGLVVEGPGNVTVRGSVAALLKTGSGSATVENGGRTFPGGVTVVMGSLKLCDAEIGMSDSDGTDSGDGTLDGSGGISVIMGGAVTAESSCGASSIEGSVIVEKGTGAVRFIGTTFAAGDLIVIERAGSIAVDTSSLSDVKLERNTGDIELLRVMADSDATIGGNHGRVTINDSAFVGDVEIENNGGDIELLRVMTDDSAIGGNQGRVTISDAAFVGDVEIKNNGDVSLTYSSFALEDVSVSNNEDVVIADNQDFNITATENESVALTRNNLTDADIRKTSGSVTILGNTGEVLKCSDNYSVANLGGNSFTELTDGQCAGL